MQNFTRVALAMLVALQCAGCLAPRPKPTDPPSPLTTSGGDVAPTASEPTDPDALPRGVGAAIDVRDAAGVTRTYSTSVVGGEHIGKSTPTDSAGEMATVTSNRLDVNVAGAAVEDAPFVEGSIALTIQGVRRDTPTSSAGTDGDNAVLSLDPFGNLRTVIGSGSSTIPVLMDTAGLNPYVEATPHSAINSSSSATSTAIDLRGYSACWFEAEFDGSVTGSIEVWMANTSAGATAATAEKMPIYDLLAGDGLACSQVANGDPEIDVDYTDAGTNALCRWRMPHPMAYAAVRWINATGGGAAGLTVRTQCRAF